LFGASIDKNICSNISFELQLGQIKFSLLI
jgi:hypothetical protein